MALNRISRPSFPSIALPKLGRSVEIPVYMVHNSLDPEDYFFVFDFEQFVERSKSGIFARPKIRLLAGRDDFDRRSFARQFRQSFVDEFDAQRDAVTEGGLPGKGWFGWLLDTRDPGLIVSGYVARIVLAAALLTGRALVSAVTPGFLRRASREETLEASISETQEQVDTALRDLSVTIHGDLRRHALRGRRGVRLSDLEHDDWPLPGFVAQHVDTGGHT